MSMSARELEALPVGKHRVEPCLFLNVTPNGGRSWIMKVTLGGKQVERGLGKFPAVSKPAAAYMLDEAKNADAAPVKKAVAAKAEAKRSGRTLRWLMQDTFEAERPQLKESTQPKWLQPVEDHILAAVVDGREVGDMLIEEIDADTLAEVLRPVWLVKAATARRSADRLRKGLDRAEGYGLPDKTGELARAIKQLPKQPKAAARFIDGKIIPVKHREAMPWAELPAFWGAKIAPELRSNELSHPASLAVALAILTGVRWAAVREARVEEFDLKAGLWTIPPERVKQKAHENDAFVVPLSAAAVEVVRRAMQLGGELLFPGEVAGRPIAADAGLTRLRKLAGLPHYHRGRPADVGPQYTVHGFRGSLAQWALETGRDVTTADMVLGHLIGTKVSRAYLGSAGGVERRAGLLREWASFVTGA